MFRLRVFNGRPSPLEERPPAPEHDRRREEELERAGSAAARRPSTRPGRHHRAHFEEKQRHRENDGDSQPALHVDELGIRRRLPARSFAARAPCRRSGTSREPAGRSRGASGTCTRRRRRRARLPRAPPIPSARDRRPTDISRAPGGTSRGSPRNRRSSPSLRGRPSASSWPGPRSCRRRGPSRSRAERRGQCRKRQLGQGLRLRVHAALRLTRARADSA